MKKFLTAIAAIIVLSAPTIGVQTAEAKLNPCTKYRHREYIICRESGPQWMPHGMPAGKRHYPGTRMTAAGPCGLIAANQRTYGGSGLAACGRYMRARYGTWERAERFHRLNNHW